MNRPLLDDRFVSIRRVGRVRIPSEPSRRDGRDKSMLATLLAPSKRKLRLARLVSRWKRIRRKRFRFLGVCVLVLVGFFDYFAWKHLAYGQMSLGLWVGFGLLPLLSIPVTFFGLIAGAVLLSSKEFVGQKGSLG